MPNDKFKHRFKHKIQLDHEDFRILNNFMEDCSIDMTPAEKEVHKKVKQIYASMLVDAGSPITRATVMAPVGSAPSVFVFCVVKFAIRRLVASM